jgi:Ca-activated chloride channel homolog
MVWLSKLRTLVGNNKAGVWPILSLLLLAKQVIADETDAVSSGSASSSIREGLKEYAAQKFDEAQKAFAAAAAKLEADRSDNASIAAYDEACALHRKGDFDKASNRYLDAGMSRNRSIAVAAHFNLGTLAAEKGRTIAGDQPDQLPDEKRKETIESLAKAAAAYRHCLELDSKHLPSRRNLELVRQWIKHYSDRWAELDRQKRRQETTLVQFLDYLNQEQSGLLKATESMTDRTSSDQVFEWKRFQDELAGEIPYLNEKIEAELQDEKQATSSNSSASATDPERDKAIQVLKEWSNESRNHMEQSSKNLELRERERSIADQSDALKPLDRIWDAVVDFSSLLKREVQIQTKIESDLKTVGDPTKDSEADVSEWTDKEMRDVLQRQQTALRRARMLGPKAEATLQQLDSQPTESSHVTMDPKSPDSALNEPKAPTQPSPEEIKVGLQKAIELAPSVIDAMELALTSMQKKDRVEAHQHADEAKRILLEIQDAQPKQPSTKSDQQNQDQQQQDPNKDSQESNESKKQEENKSSEKSEKQDQQEKQQSQDKKQPEISKDRIADALRRVREREQEKRERDKELKAKILGRVPVEKDW